ncbi:hypothetical protein C0992_008579 [Termitomyces sp. T32_za158]|nr:hypothetical protein C0992_008579 [Termitomyces sp. T32_za158]
MIADGITIDSITLLKIKAHLANVLGFRDVASIPSQGGRLFQIQFGEISEINDFAFPCVNQLLTVMDASHRIDILPSVMANVSDHDEKPVPVLAGTAIEVTAKLVVSQGQHHSQDVLSTQAKAFLDSSLTKYVLFSQSSGKRQLHQNFFVVLKQIVDSNARNNPTAPQSLCELLYRDVLTRGLDTDHVNFQNVLNNTRSYVEIVYHEGFSSELMQFTGQQFIQFSRRAIEWNPESMNPDSILIACAVVVYHNKALSRAVMTTYTPGGFTQLTRHFSSLLGLVEPAIHFIQNHPWQDGENDFSACLAAARFILQASTQDPNVINRLSDSGTEGLAISSESALIDLNYAYIAIKLWILLASKVSESGGVGKDLQTLAVWNELWPPFEGLIDQFELDLGGALYLTAGTLVISSVAELFIFLRTLHTPIALDVSVHITTLNRLRQLGPGDALNQKAPRLTRMDIHAFASLAHVRILLVPVGSIPLSLFEKYAAEIRSFESIRLGDIPADHKDERGEKE